MLAHQRLELADQRRVPAEREIRVDPVLERRQALLLEPGSLGLRERLVREVRQRRSAPQRQRLPQPLARPPGVPLPKRRAPRIHQRLETVHVQLPARGLRADTRAPG